MSSQNGLNARMAKALSVIADIRLTAFKAYESLEDSNDAGTAETKGILLAHLEHLRTIIPELQPYSNLVRHIGFNQRADYRDMIVNDLPSVEERVRKALIDEGERTAKAGAGLDLVLDHEVAKQVLPLYQGEHYKQAVLTAFDVLTEQLRLKSGLTSDGVDLANQALSPKNPRILIITGDKPSDENLRAGYADLIRGAYRAIRNVYAHGGSSLKVTEKTALRHLALVSNLVRRVREGKTVALPPPST